MEEEFQFTREHLEQCTAQDNYTVVHWRAAWDRLRQVCRELGCDIPTMAQIIEMKLDEEIAKKMNSYPPSFVLTHDIEGRKEVMLNFDIGYKQSSE